MADATVEIRLTDASSGGAAPSAPPAAPQLVPNAPPRAVPVAPPALSLAQPFGSPAAPPPSGGRDVRDLLLEIEQNTRRTVAAVLATGGRGGPGAPGMFPPRPPGPEYKKEEKFDYIGSARNKVEDATRAVIGQANRSIDRFGAFSPDVAIAQAGVEARRVQGDFARAQHLGPELAGFATAQGNFEQAKEDALAELLKPVLPLLTRVLEIATQFLDVVTPVVTTIIEAIWPALEVIVRLIGKGLEVLAYMAKKLHLIDENTRPLRDHLQGHDFLEDILAAPARAGRMGNNPQAGAGLGLGPRGGAAGPAPPFLAGF
jgi:hypothetical protein